MRKTLEKALDQFGQLYGSFSDDAEFMEAFKELRELHWAVLLDPREFHKNELTKLGVAVGTTWSIQDIDAAFDNSDHEMPKDMTDEDKLKILNDALDNDYSTQEMWSVIDIIIDQYMEDRK